MSYKVEKESRLERETPIIMQPKSDDSVSALQAVMLAIILLMVCFIIAFAVNIGNLQGLLQNIQSRQEVPQSPTQQLVPMPIPSQGPQGQVGPPGPQGAPGPQSSPEPKSPGLSGSSNPTETSPTTNPPTQEANP